MARFSSRIHEVLQREMGRYNGYGLRTIPI